MDPDVTVASKLGSYGRAPFVEEWSRFRSCSDWIRDPFDNPWMGSCSERRFEGNGMCAGPLVMMQLVARMMCGLLDSAGPVPRAAALMRRQDLASDVVNALADGIDDCHQVIAR